MYTVADFQMGEIVRESAPAYQSVSGAAKRAFRVPQRDLLGTGAA